MSHDESQRTGREAISTPRLLGALALSALLLGPFTFLIYDAGLAQSAAAIAGALILLALALAVAWASQRRRGRGTA